MTNTNKTLSKKEFIHTILAEIKEIVSSHPYQSFVLMAVFIEFAKLDLSLTIFNNAKVTDGLSRMAQHYKPSGLWLVHKETEAEKHLQDYNGLICLVASKTLEQIEEVVNKINFDNTPFLRI